MCIRDRNLSVIRPGKLCTSYKLDIYECKVAKFTGVISKAAEDNVSSLEYLIALEPDSEY